MPERRPTPTTHHAPPESPRDALLQAALDVVVARGMADLSLRALADEIGTSHRMLIYHFGSKEGLAVAVAQALDERLFATAGPTMRELADDPVAATRAVWREVSAPAHRDEQVLMLELFVAAMRHRPGTEGVPGRLTDWVAASEAQAEWLGDDARRQSRLLAAVVRGLLVDLLLTGERAEVDDALERYLELAEADPRLAAMSARARRRQATGRPSTPSRPSRASRSRSSS